MTLKEIIELSYYRCDEERETEKDIQMETVFINAINQGYCFIATTIDKKTKSSELAYADKINLPTDYFQLIELSHSTYGVLSKADYIIEGDLLLPKLAEITTGVFTLTYIFIPSFITNETSEIPIKSMYATALAAYASYQYMISQKQYNSATMFLSEFNMILGKNNKEVIKNEA